jgi:hypothetical protein
MAQASRCTPDRAMLLLRWSMSAAAQRLRDPAAIHVGEALIPIRHRIDGGTIVQV